MDSGEGGIYDQEGTSSKDWESGGERSSGSDGSALFLDLGGGYIGFPLVIIH